MTTETITDVYIKNLAKRGIQLSKAEELKERWQHDELSQEQEEAISVFSHVSTFSTVDAYINKYGNSGLNVAESLDLLETTETGYKITPMGTEFRAYVRR